MDLNKRLHALSGLRLDPYWLWAAATEYRDYLAPNETRTVAVAIECLTTLADLEARLAKPSLSEIRLSPLYTANDHNPIKPAVARYCTATLPVGNIWDLLPLVKRLELGTAVRTRDPGFPTFIPADSKRKRVVGVIDDFVAFGNDCFAGSGGASRVRYVWSQELAPPPSIDSTQWYAPKDLGYGFELNSMRGADGEPAPSLSKLRSAYPPVLSRASHGTPVAFLAAGNHRNLGNCTADIIAVHLPRRMVADTSGGALNVQVLDGIRYILRRAGKAASVVVNLSYGTMAGPHDGSSILEEAIDDLVDRCGGRLAVVLPAGNAYELRGHAVLNLKKGASSTLHWIVAPDCATPSFMEIWLPDGAQSVAISVTDPSGRSVTIARPPFMIADTKNPRDSTFGVVYLTKVANGNTGTMILIALAPTGSTRPGRAPARSGEWLVTLRNEGTSHVAGIHAWIERDDTLHGQPQRGRQSYFFDANYKRSGRQPGESSDDPSSLVQRQGAFNTIAGGEHTIVVGGFVGTPKDGQVSRESGGGPLRHNAHKRRGPEVLARTDESRVLHGLRVAANGLADTVRMNGTSVAAPQVVRKIADWYLTSPRLTATDIRAKLADAVCVGIEEPDPHREGVGRIC